MLHVVEENHLSQKVRQKQQFDSKLGTIHQPHSLNLCQLQDKLQVQHYIEKKLLEDLKKNDPLVFDCLVYHLLKTYFNENRYVNSTSLS